MTDMAGSSDPAKASPGSAGLIPAVLAAWIVAALVLAGMWLAGILPNVDFDDQLKLLKVRYFLDGASWFDATVPGILQPEAFHSHWPRILDLFYAAPAWALTPFAGADAGLRIAAFAVPLLLLLPVLVLFRRYVGAIGFVRRDAAFLLALVPAARALFEFEPGRIDYHNLQILLLFASMALTLSRRPAAALANGAVVAVALALSLEFAPFFALVMAILALDFVSGGPGGATRLGRFGVGLAAGALVCYPAIVPPSAYVAVACDVYSLPHVLALGFAGLVFVAVALAPTRRPVARALAVAVPAAAGATLLAFLFPQCLAGPYAGLDDYVRQVWLLDIAQERSLFARPDLIFSAGLAGLAALAIGATAPALAAARGGFRDRDLTIAALFALMALVLSLAYARYLRYLPLFGGPGLVFAVACLAPRLRAAGALLETRLRGPLPSAWLLTAPGLLVALALVGFQLAWPSPISAAPAAKYAGSCDLGAIPAYGWPGGARIMAPPRIGITLLSLSGDVSVVAVPFHTAAAGIERAYRFLDPATSDPRAVFEASRSTHVAICAWRGKPPAALMARYGFAARLMAGGTPAWLEECPTADASPIRIYHRAGAADPASACPAAP